jgi:hypothetical protein
MSYENTITRVRNAIILLDLENYRGVDQISFLGDRRFRIISTRKARKYEQS